MEIFLDSAVTEEIVSLSTMGLIQGVTTNPSLISKSGHDFKNFLKQITEAIKLPFSAEVMGKTFSEMMEEANILAQIRSNIVIKLPLTPEGLHTCSQLSAQGIKTNVTLCFTPNQALLAANAGATYISPFVGRLEDISQDGMQLISDIRKIYDAGKYKTKILAASIRTPKHIMDVALLGADVATCPYKVIMSLFDHPLTQKGLEMFERDWNNSKQSSIIPSH